MDMGFLGGIMDKCLKDNGKWEARTVLECGHHLMAAFIKDNGT